MISGEAGGRRSRGCRGRVGFDRWIVGFVVAFVSGVSGVFPDRLGRDVVDGGAAVEALPTAVGRFALPGPTDSCGLAVGRVGARLGTAASTAPGAFGNAIAGAGTGVSPRTAMPQKTTATVESAIAAPVRRTRAGSALTEGRPRRRGSCPRSWPRRAPDRRPPEDPRRPLSADTTRRRSLR